MILPGSPVDFINHVVVLADGKDKTSGTIYAYIRRQTDGYWWSLASLGSWVLSKPTGADVPTATYVAQGLWKFNLSGTVTNTLTEGDSVVCRMTDSESEATATVTSDICEHSVRLPTGSPVASVTGSVGSVVGLTPANIDAIKAKTDNLPANPASQTNLDVAVSTRLAAASYPGALTVGAIADAVWDEDMTAHNITNTAGHMLVDMGASAGIGSELLTVTILDPNLDPIQAAAVYCHNVSGALVAHSMTNASGVVVLAPGAGVNTITAYYTGFSFASQSVTVSVGVNTTAQLTAITTTIPVGTSPGRCAVYARLQLPDGTPAVGVVGKAHVRSLPSKLADVFVAGTAITATSAADGLISFDLPRGAHCVVTIPDHLPRCFVEVPDLASYELLGTATI